MVGLPVLVLVVLGASAGSSGGVVVVVVVVAAATKLAIDTTTATSRATRVALLWARCCVEYVPWYSSTMVPWYQLVWRCPPRACLVTRKKDVMKEDLVKKCVV
jgi:hypothetical protein